MKKVLITGAAGLIGSVLIEGLSTDYELLLADKRSVNSNRFHRVDLSSFEETLELFERIDFPECVIHLAADSNVNASWKSVLSNNIIATRNIFEVSNRFGAEKIVFASSNHVTGLYEADPNFKYKIYSGGKGGEISPSHSYMPDSLYGVSKVFGEQLGRYYSLNYGVSVICLRIGSLTKSNRPETERHLATWISHDDLVQLVKNSIENKNIEFGVYYGVSDNERRIWDISGVKKDLSYEPRDKAEEL